MIDLNPNHLDTVQRILAEHVSECEVRAFGSRATWTAKDYSDLDLAIVGKGSLNWRTLGRLKEAFEESSLPMRVDVLDWHDIAESFQRVIEQDYVVLQEGTIERITAVSDEWIHCTLADACSAINYGLTASASSRSDGPKFLRITDIVSGPLDWNDVPHVETDEDTTDKYRLHDGDIVIARTGASTGASAYVTKPPIAVFASYLVRLQVKPEFDARYVGYYLKSNEFAEYIRGVLGDKSAQPNASASTMTAAPLRVPRSKVQQRAIAHVLGTLDDKIELDRRMNETLEAMARALFKSWFVDFEPVRAKMEGRWRRGESLPGLPADLYDLFPDKLVESELGEIPEGWEVGVLNDAIEILSGGTPKTSIQEYWDGGIPWYTAKDAPSLSDIFVLTTERSISQAGVEHSSTKVLPVGTTVITARGTVGRLACLGIPMAMNQTCYGLRGASGYPDYFTYWNVRNTVSDLRARTHGTIFDTITRETFKIAETVLAPPSVAKAFESVLGPLMKRILGNLNESCALAAQRDTLLPGLVSGEVGVGVQELFSSVPPR